MVAFLAVIQALPAFFQALPHLCEVVLKLINLLEKFIAYSKKKEFLKLLDDIEGTIDKLDEAKTPEQKRDAARAMAELIRKLN